MSMYTVTTAQILCATVLSAFISAGSVVGYQQYKEHQSIPVVQQNQDSKCIKVINFKNGDAYNCEDIDVVLRDYRRTTVIEKMAPP
jgi:hypothetical protein